MKVTVKANNTVKISIKVHRPATGEDKVNGVWMSSCDEMHYIGRSQKLELLKLIGENGVLSNSIESTTDSRMSLTYPKNFVKVDAKTLEAVFRFK